jgi:hypothetical protein
MVTVPFFISHSPHALLVYVMKFVLQMKKVIVKALKGKVKEVACSETGHVLLLALFDSIDDTVLVKKVRSRSGLCYT